MDKNLDKRKHFAYPNRSLKPFSHLFARDLTLPSEYTTYLLNHVPTLFYPTAL